MRTVTFGINITLDGYCDHTLMNPAEELMDYYTAMMDDVDLLFFGRVMYQLMFPYWADVAREQSGTDGENRFAERMASIDRVVISGSLNTADEKTRIVRTDPAGELLRLKQLPGKKIMVDTVSMLPELIKAGLIDELKLVVHPVIAGQGRPLLQAGSIKDKLNLKLVDTIRFPSGCMALHYVK
ncbi:deaminase [Mucilaginibacter hurinus]|uniref:Deaminase n=1 Tax=Mucilaginibacter hurinus TaxID=2201324 RepID=A0A367GSQ2_9SPHI|nr:dihydrofolate reductase family protein [Mucilaginibacter hurinus]RCH56280.1 deaminase [Mucilaginibacter hurinus]